MVKAADNREGQGEPLSSNASLGSKETMRVDESGFGLWACPNGN